MTKIALLFAFGLLAVACGSPAASNSTLNRSSAVSSATNVNTANAMPYSGTENAYTFAQISQFTYDLAPSGKEARELVGKTVSESKLWQNKKFVIRLRQLMGPDYAIMRRFWNTETPIKKFGDFLMMTGCEQHNCTENQYVIFMDLGDGTINVVHIGKDSTREWNSWREILHLPPPFEEEIEAMKSRREEDNGN